MMRRLSIIVLPAAIALGLAAGPAIAAESASADSSPARVAMTDEGPLFVTPAGMTLYSFGPDATRPGNPICTDEAERTMDDPTAGFGKYPLAGAQYQRACTAVYPPFVAPAGAVARGDWSIVTRPTGLRQWAYRGRPLYTSIKDHSPSDHNGSEAGASARRGWSYARPPSDFPLGLGFVRDADALVVATANGRPVFTPRAGLRPASACAECASEFEPVLAPAVAQFGGNWSAIDVGGGRRQLAFRSKPLFIAPDSMLNSEIAGTGRWDTVVFRPIAPAPAQIGKRQSLLGEIYTDQQGMSLYTFSCMTLGSSINAVGCEIPGGPATYWSALCGKAEECSRRWRPYRADDKARASGEWTIVDVADPMFTDPAGTTYPEGTPRVRAWAYRGRPVYTYFEDKQPGDIWGNEIRWYGMAYFNAIVVPGRSAIE